MNRSDTDLQATQSLDLGVVGNSSLAAIINRDAGLSWMCMPRMDGDPVFCGLLNPIGDEQDAEIESLQATIDVQNIERDNLNVVITDLRSVIEDHERTIDNLLCEVSDLRQ